MKSLKLLVFTLSVAMLMAISACASSDSVSKLSALDCDKAAKLFIGMASQDTIYIERVDKITEISELSYQPRKVLICSGLAHWKSGKRDIVTFQVEEITTLKKHLIIKP